MANATAVPTVTYQHKEDTYKVLGTLAVDASPATYVTGGIALSFFQAAIKASRTPLAVNVVGIAGYKYEYVAGVDASTGKLIIRAQTSGAAAGDPLGELAASAIPAGVSGDTITFEATFKGFF